MKTTLRTIAAVLLCCLLVGTGCSPQDSMAIQIDSVGWVYWNIDHSYWHEPWDAATCLCEFTVVYSGSDITAEDIASATVSHVATGSTWNLMSTASNLDAEDGRIGSGRFYTTELASNGSVFPIGPFHFVVRLKNGKEATYDFDAPAPGRSESNGNQYTYTEDYTVDAEEGYAPMLKRAVTGSSAKGSDAITISFSSDDPLFFGGWVTFLDAQRDLVGYSPIFREYGTGVIRSILNGGASLDNTGGQDELVIPASDIDYEAGKSYDDIDRFHVALTDGSQYAGTDYTYDCVSYGVMTLF